MQSQKDRKLNEDQRDAVKENMKKATEKEPAEFRDDANEHKHVKIGEDLAEDPIQGIDPKS